MAPASLSPTHTLVPAFSQQLIILKCLVRRKTVLTASVRNGCGGLRDLGADQGESYSHESNNRFRWMVPEQGCVRGDVSDGMILPGGVWHGGYHRKAGGQGNIQVRRRLEKGIRI